jgi:ABC-type multidrug transport system fused ATPase/permease subunit
MKENSFYFQAKSLWVFINANRRHQLFSLIVVMIFSSIAEIVSIGSVVPFITYITAPEKIYSSKFLQSIIFIFSIPTSVNLLLLLTVTFSFCALLAGIVRLLLLRLTSNFSFNLASDLCNNIFVSTLNQNYESYISSSSAEVISVVLTKVSDVIYQIVIPALNLVTAIFLTVAIVIGLIMLDPMTTIISFGAFGFIYYLLLIVTKKRLSIDSQKISQSSLVMIKTLQEGLGGFRDIKLSNNQEYFTKIFKNADETLRQAQSNNLFISASPRFIMESLGLLVIAFMAYFMSGKSSNAIPVLAALALGAQRLLPLFQQIYNSVSTIRGANFVLKDTLKLLKKEVQYKTKDTSLNPILFRKNIELQNIIFNYPGRAGILNGVSLNIAKGSRLGVIGSTGSGKSTLVDIITGLIRPSSGKVLIDGNELNFDLAYSCRKKIAHVAQNIYLADTTILKNIAFGVSDEEIDFLKVEKAAKFAQLESFIENLDDKYQTLVGERGVNLSGGQKQRLGIARALYLDAELIILDEATSALDDKTEYAVMQSIYDLNKKITLIIIAHRTSTLKDCDQIIEVSVGKISKIYSYKELELIHVNRGVA